MIVAISWKEELECRAEVEVADEAEAETIVGRLNMGTLADKVKDAYEELNYEITDADWETVEP